jgi:PAN domain
VGSRRWASIVTLTLLTMVALSRTEGQDQVSNLKTDWRAQRFSKVLRPLLEYRDSLGAGGDFEVDYMIGTSMCHISDFNRDGISYLWTLPAAYPGGLTFDGRKVSIAKAVNDYCGCAGVDSKSDSRGCAGQDTKGDSPTAKQINAGAIRQSVKQRLHGSLAFEDGFDRPGQDYRSFSVAGPQSCRQECEKDSNCKAFTYVKPGPPGARGVCWLKRVVPERTSNQCCISAVK